MKESYITLQYLSHTQSVFINIYIYKVDHRSLRTREQDEVLLQEAHHFMQSFFIIADSHGANRLLHNVLFVNKKATVRPWKGQCT